MRRYFSSFALIGLLLYTASAFAQKYESQGWVFITHTHKLNTKFDFLGDIQARSSDWHVRTNTLLLRAALSYNLNKKNSIGIGSAYKTDREGKMYAFEYTKEYRIFQQYMLQYGFSNVEFVVRGRLEQRWITENSTQFSQRGRIFASAQVPLFANHGFKHGLYLGLQNELFLNLINKKNVNGTYFDQNRTFLSIGYRWNTLIDSEIGYMYWYQDERGNSFRRNVIQLQVTTNL